jgi:glucosamine 6-phosphate synthetase-like amidotransferase/phosphosugar isomerase protein
MLKEIFEQPESVVDTMRGRINFDNQIVSLGGIKGQVSSTRLCFYISCLKQEVSV